MEFQNDNFACNTLGFSLPWCSVLAEGETGEWQPPRVQARIGDNPVFFCNCSSSLSLCTELHRDTSFYTDHAVPSTSEDSVFCDSIENRNWFVTRLRLSNKFVLCLARPSELCMQRKKISLQLLHKRIYSLLQEKHSTMCCRCHVCGLPYDRGESGEYG